MKRIFSFLIGAMAMVAVALLSAFIAMRLAIHGREAVVPALTGLSIDRAGDAASSQGLALTVESQFYSAEVPAGVILAQDPPPGSRVRRDWPIRVTESLGPQRVSIPDLTGESERAASVSIRRLSLQLGNVAHLDVPGEPDLVLTQTPAPDAAGVDGPRISLLVSDPGSDASQHTAYVMPLLLGLTYATAANRAASAGLHLVVNSALAGDTPTQQPPSATVSTPAAPPQAAPVPLAPPPPNPNDRVVAQTPLPGRRVVRGEAVRVVLTPATQPAPLHHSEKIPLPRLFSTRIPA
jgi:beta-lactam-binding protein with PASTA domain